MLDTVKLFTNEFELASDHKFEKQTTVAMATGELKRERRYCNIEHGASFNIKKGFNGLGESLYCQVSLPKLIYGTSLKELQAGDLDHCIDSINKQFVAAGAIIDKDAVETMPASRIDYCKNIQVDHCIVDYLSQLKNCFIAGRTGTNWKLESVTFYNGSQAFTAYNKILEVLSNDYSSKIAGITKETKQNILRLESRLLKARAIQQNLKRKTFVECFDFELGKRKLITDFNKLVLDDGQQLELNFNSDLERLQELRSIYERGAFQQWRAEYGTAGILLKYNYDLDLIRKLLLNVFSKRMTAYHLRELKAFISQHRTQEQRNLLQEIRYKLAA